MQKTNDKGYVENLYAEGRIRTHTGIYVNVFDPKPEMFCIEDIAHALAHQCRFGGHLPKFYSVAQHSVFCADYARMKNYDIEQQYACLMHDCSEAYLLDIPKPIKDKIPQYKELEHNLMIQLSKHFRFSYPLSKEVKEIDAVALEYEWQNIMLAERVLIYVRPPYHAKADFLSKYYHLRYLVEESRIKNLNTSTL